MAPKTLSQEAIFARNRAHGLIDLSVTAHDGRTRRQRVVEEGSFRVRFPQVSGPEREAVILNTAGGIAGGDDFSIAIEAGPYGIRCNAVAPGLVESKWVEKQRERYAAFAEATPLRRHARAVDVANTIAFLCSEESAHITGEIINVSGGWYLSP